MVYPQLHNTHAVRIMQENFQLFFTLAPAPPQPLQHQGADHRHTQTGAHEQMGDARRSYMPIVITKTRPRSSGVFFRVEWLFTALQIALYGYTDHTNPAKPARRASSQARRSLRGHEPKQEPPGAAVAALIFRPRPPSRPQHRRPGTTRAKQNGRASLPRCGLVSSQVSQPATCAEDGHRPHRSCLARGATGQAAAGRPPPLSRPRPVAACPVAVARPMRTRSFSSPVAA